MRGHKKNSLRITVIGQPTIAFLVAESYALSQRDPGISDAGVAVAGGGCDQQLMISEK